MGNEEKKREMNNKNQSILLVDGHSIINRAFYGLGQATHFSSSDGTPTGAVFGFFNICSRYLNELEPSHMCVAFDRHEPTFRHEKYDDYKGTRKPFPEDLKLQIPVVKEILDAMGVQRIELPGYEADDLLGTLAKYYQKEGFTVWLLSGDRDSFQIVDEHITVIMPEGRRFGGQATFYDPAKVKEKYGVTPLEYIDVKAIMGDKSDNIPGVDGIGEKGATRLIQTYGSLDNVYAHLEELKPGEKKRLTSSKDMALLSKDLVTIKLDVPIEISLSDSLRPNLDETQAYEALKKYDLNSLIKKYGLEAEHTDEGKNILAELEVQESTPEALLTQLAETKMPAREMPLDSQNDFNSETDNGDVDAILSTFSDPILITGFFTAKDSVDDLPFSSSDDLERTIAVSLKRGELTQVTADHASIAQLFEALCENERPLLGHNLKRWFRFFDRAPKQIPFDVETGAYLLNEGTGKQLKLEKLAERIGIVPFDESDAKQTAALIYYLFDNQFKAIKERDLAWLTFAVDMPLIPVLGRMEAAGFTVDNDRLTELSKSYENEITELEKTIHDYAGKSFNINSPKQLAEVLYEDLGLPTGKRNPSKQYSTDMEEMERLLPQHPIIERIMRYRQITKLKSTFIDGLGNYIRKDGRIHCHFNQNLTATGRLSSSDPNLQNIPIRDAEGREVRKAFVAPEGYVLIDADYSQIELRLLAHLAGDEVMINGFKENKDIHKLTASTMFDVPLTEVDSDMRRAAKTVNFSIIYGVSDYGLSKDLDVTVKEARNYINGYYKQYEGIRTYLDKQIAQAKELGYVETMFGRRRYIPELKAKSRNQRMFGERVAMNTPVQGTAADIIRLAMIVVENRLRAANLESRLISQVHDELIIEAPEQEAETAANILRDSMENVVSLSVPLLTSLNIADNWFATE